MAEGIAQSRASLVRSSIVRPTTDWKAESKRKQLGAGRYWSSGKAILVGSGQFLHFSFSAGTLDPSG
jgi:hypothetical protein